MKLQYFKTNPGNWKKEKEIYSKLENLNGLDVIISPSEVKIYKGKNIILCFPITFLSEDVFTKTYTTKIDNEVKIRICIPNTTFGNLLGNSISFASMLSDGFAVHYNII